MRLNLRLTGASDRLAARLFARVNGQWPDALGVDDAVPLTVAVDGLEDDAAWFAVAVEVSRTLAGARQAPALPTTDSAGLSRRDLLGIFAPRRGTAEPVPHVHVDACQLATGCRRCIESCPAAALSTQSSRLVLDDGQCTRCGLCTAACPVGVVDQPPACEAGFETVLAVIGAFAVSRKDIVVAISCERQEPLPWVADVDVADVGAVGLRWLARAAACGAVAVVVGCADATCLESDAARSAASNIAAAIGDDGPAVQFVDGPISADAIDKARAAGRPVPPVLSDGDAWTGYAEAIAAIARPTSQIDGLGFTTVRVSSACTSCGACTRACHRKALQLDDADGLTMLVSDCSACGACAGVCPEQALNIVDAQGTLADARRRQTVHPGDIVKCRKCGNRIGPRAMLLKVADLLGTPGTVDDLCGECKASAGLWRGTT